MLVPHEITGIADAGTRLCDTEGPPNVGRAGGGMFCTACGMMGICESKEFMK